MPIRVNNCNPFTINTLIENYPIATGITVQRGDLLKITEVEGVSYVTTTINGDEAVDAIAIHSGSGGTTIPCYVLMYRATYDELSIYPHIVLCQFTNGELRRILISRQISKACSAISVHPCNLISRYTCDNLNTFGARTTSIENT